MQYLLCLLVVCYANYLHINLIVCLQIIDNLDKPMLESDSKSHKTADCINNFLHSLINVL